MAMATVRTRRADTSSWSSSGDSDANSTGVSIVTITSKRVSSDATDTCRCQSNAVDTNGPSQRSCHDCLNVALQSGDECAINPYGKCVSAANRFVKQVADSYSFEAPGVGCFYLASNFSYCERTEPSCARCRGEWISEYRTGYFGSQSDRIRRQGSSSSSSLVCIGADGCLCLAYCELESYRASIPDTCALKLAAPPSQSTFDSGFSDSSNNRSSTAVAWVQYFFALMAFLVILAPLVITARKRIRSNISTLDIFYTQPEQPQQEQQNPQRQPRAPPLSLGGWRDDREKLKITGDPSRFRSGTSSDATTASAGEIATTTSENQASSHTQQPHESEPAIVLSRNDNLS